MRRYALAATLMATNYAGHTVSFDCDKAVTVPERLICSDRGLSILDSAVSKAYQRHLAETQDPRALRTEQRNWIRDVRDQCDDVSCLIEAYSQRLARFNTKRVMTKDRAEAICQTVVKRLNDGSIINDLIQLRPANMAERDAWQRANPELFTQYLQGALDIDYDGDGNAEKLGLIGGGGTCRDCDIIDLGAPVSHRGPPGQDEEDEERLRWADWSGCDHFLMIEGEPIVINGNFGQGPTEATLVSWFAEDGAKEPLCRLGKNTSVDARLIFEKDKRLCRSILNNQVEAMPWPVSVSLAQKELEKYGIRSDSAAATRVDIDGDDDEETIALATYSSGAGCGSYQEWLLELTPDAKSIADTALSKTLRNREWGPMNKRDAPALWYSTQILPYEGKHYILGKGEKDHAEVVSLADGEVTTWCRYKLIPQHNVEVYYARPGQ